MKILLNSRKSIDSTNKQSGLSLDLDSTFKNQPDLDIIKYVDAYQRFLDERASSNRYRVILTINPYCTNVLFNPFTEIVKYDGNSYVRALDNDTISVPPAKVGGKYYNIKRADMVDDTEYSKEDIGFTYYPGYDILGNHIVRNNSFKIVNPKKNANADRNRFNRIDDYMRDCFGEGFRFQKRSIDGTYGNNDQYKHLYNKDDIDTFKTGDAAANKLYGNNGWYGFYNKSAIDSKEKIEVPTASNPQRKLDRPSLDINNVINYKENGCFIDMYPDRRLFSFSPSRNDLTGIEESQWNIFLTYCFGEFREHPLIWNADEGKNGLLVYSARYCTGVNGMKVVMFKTFTRHGLKYGTNYSLWSKDNDEETGLVVETGEVFFANGVGDLSKENDEYFFYSNGNNVLYDLFSGRVVDFLYSSENQNVYIIPDGDPMPSQQIGNIMYVRKDGSFFVWRQDASAYVQVPHYKIFYSTPTSLIPTYVNENFFLYSGYSSIDPEEIPSHHIAYEVDEIPESVNSSSHPYIKIRNESEGFDYYELIIDVYGVNTDGIDEDGTIEDVINERLSNLEIRINRVVNGMKSEYYFRKMRKIPNYKFSGKKITDDIASDEESLASFISENAADGGIMYEFDNETYDAAFSTTIYGDKVTQRTFTDDVNLECLRDNKGKLLSDIYVTVIKRNEGRRDWYFGEVKAGDIFESSRCFGDLTSGVEIPIGKNDGTDFIKKAKAYSGAYSINDFERYGGNSEYDDDCYTLEDYYHPVQEGRKFSISWRDSEFMGDLVDYNAMEYAERTISDVMYRFNTMQRDGSEGDMTEIKSMFKYAGTDIIFDDYDWGDPVNQSGATFRTTGEDDSASVETVRREGYFYKAHYKIPVKEMGSVKQAGCETVWCTAAEDFEEENGEKFVKVTSRFPHRLSVHDGLYVCSDDETSGFWHGCRVTRVETPMVFYINNPESYDIATYIVSRELVIRKENSDIPPCASKIGKDQFVWRDNLNVGDPACKVLPEYPFANGCIYVDRTINFYLRRQDPNNQSGLYFFIDGDSVNRDIEGVSKTDNTQLYKDENYYTC